MSLQKVKFFPAVQVCLAAVQALKLWFLSVKGNWTTHMDNYSQKTNLCNELCLFFSSKNVGKKMQTCRVRQGNLLIHFVYSLGWK